MISTKELYADSVQFQYTTDHPLLSGAYLKCEVGDIIALLGRNGSGKSTFLNIIFGSLKANYSYIRINGRKMAKTFLSKKIGYLPQDSFLPSNELVLTMIKLMLPLKKQQDELLKNSILRDILDKKIHELSAGELRYLEIYLLISQPTDFVLLDEPFTGLSPIFIDEVMALIDKYKHQKGFVISDHNYMHVLHISTQIWLLQNGGCRRINHKKELELFYTPEGVFGD